MENETIIKLNSYSYPVHSYSKYTSVDEGKVSSYASITFKKGVTADSLEPLLLEEITTVQIWKGEEMIYEISNKHGKISNINESYSDGGMSVYANISF